MMSQDKKKGFSLHPGYMVMAALGMFICFILYLIFNFYQKSTDALSELVTDNYYQEELDYQRVIDAKNSAAKLSEQPKVSLNTEGISVVFPMEFTNQNSQFRYYLYRPNDRSLDVKKAFRLIQNTLQIPKDILVKGGYILKVYWKKGDIDYQIDFDVIWN